MNFPYEPLLIFGMVTLMAGPLMRSIQKNERRGAWIWLALIMFLAMLDNGKRFGMSWITLVMVPVAGVFCYWGAKLIALGASKETISRKFLFGTPSAEDDGN